MRVNTGFVDLDTIEDLRRAEATPSELRPVAEAKTSESASMSATPVNEPGKSEEPAPGHAAMSC